MPYTGPELTLLPDLAIRWFSGRKLVLYSFIFQNSSRSLSLQGLDVDALPYKILLILPAAINAYIGLETESESISGIEKTCNTLTFSKGNWAKPIELESESDIFLLIIVLWWKSRNYKIYGQSCKMSQIWQIYLCKFGWTEIICVKKMTFCNSVYELTACRWSDAHFCVCFFPKPLETLFIGGLPLPRLEVLLEGGCLPIQGCLEEPCRPHHLFDPLTQVREGCKK